MVIAYVTRNPLGIFALDDKKSEKFEKVLNIPFTRKEEDVHEAQDQVTPEGTDKTTEPRWQDQLDLSHVDDQELRGNFIKMLEKHEDMWRPGKLGTVDASYHRIELEPGTKPIRQAPYRQGHKGRDIQQQEITKMLDARVIEPATGEWASPVVLVPKKDGYLRLCIDYRRLNAKTVPEVYPLPRMDECLDSLGDAAVFKTLECNSGYWQVPIAPKDRGKTTFTTHLGTFRHLRMPFGLRNGPATFQRALDIIFSGVRWQTCLIYLDEVMIFSKDITSYLGHVDEILTLLGQAGITLKLNVSFSNQGLTILVMS